MKVIEAPSIQFKCRCGAVNEGEPEEFRPRHTTPPSFVATCAFCRCDNVVFPTALIARAAGDVIAGITRRTGGN